MILQEKIADEQSFTEAIFTAIKIFRNRSEYNELMNNRLQPRKMAVDNGIDEDLPDETEG
jgi:4-hydroxythreonine-4-phosphate dehydrogenase